jgi:ribose-phosphate pyrophosphokinase
VHAADAPFVIACAAPCCRGRPSRGCASQVDQLVVTDTIPLRPEASALDKITVLPVASLLAEAIQRTHDEASISSLFV